MNRQLQPGGVRIDHGLWNFISGARLPGVAGGLPGAVRADELAVELPARVDGARRRRRPPAGPWPASGTIQPVVRRVEERHAALDREAVAAVVQRPRGPARAGAGTRRGAPCAPAPARRSRRDPQARTGTRCAVRRSLAPLLLALLRARVVGRVRARVRRGVVRRVRGRVAAGVDELLTSCYDEFDDDCSSWSSCSSCWTSSRLEFELELPAVANGAPTATTPVAAQGRGPLPAVHLPTSLPVG